MSNQMSIQPGPTSVSSGESTVRPKGSTPAQSPANTAVTKPASKPVQLFVNPSYQFDPTVGIEVIQFHDNSGAVTSTIPSERQLAAYRTHQETPPGEQSAEPPQTTPQPDARAGAA